MWAMRSCVLPHHRYIGCSQPHINNLTAIGCIIGLMSVFLMGLDGQYVSEDQFPMVCSVSLVPGNCLVRKHPLMCLARARLFGNCENDKHSK